MALLALTRAVSPRLASCELTHLARQPIDAGRAERQHEAYEQALRELGCRVERLPALPDQPDAVFVEDTAVVLDELAVVTRPGAASRRAETASAAAALAVHRPLRRIEPPATLDGGDVLACGRRVFVGLSSRSDPAAVEQLRAALGPHGYAVAGVPLGGCLHLKTAVTEAAPGLLLLNPGWVDPLAFAPLQWLAVDPAEPMAANGLRVGGTLLYPAAFPRTRARLAARGLEVRALELDELAKAEGAVTCCSLLLRLAGGD
jgi:dimethylargininase